MAKAVGAATFHQFPKLAEPLRVRILSYNCETALLRVSRAMKSANEKAMEQEWRGMKAEGAQEPLSALTLRVRSLDQPQFKPQFFKTLFEAQRKLAYRTAEGNDAFNLLAFENGDSHLSRKPGSFSRMRFQEAEGIVKTVDEEMDENLRKAWMGAAGISDRILSVAPNAFAEDLYPETGEKIRAWLNREKHQPILDQITDIRLESFGLTALPPEIAKLRRLDVLILHHNSLYVLPDELVELRVLRYLFVSHNRLYEVPAVALRLFINQGCLVSLTSNPIHALTEEMYNSCSTWRHWLGMPFDEARKSFLFEPSDTSFFVVANHPSADYGETHVEISKENLQSVPFSLWLRERLQIPSVAFLIGRRLFASEYFNACLDNTPPLLTIPLSVLFFVAEWAVGIPTWLVNQFLSLVIVPIVTWVRDKLGYGRMIEIK